MKPGKSLTLVLSIMVLASFPKMHAFEYGLSTHQCLPSLMAGQAVDQEPEQRLDIPAANAGGTNAAVAGVILTIWAGIALFVVILSRKLARVEQEIAAIIKHERDQS